MLWNDLREYLDKLEELGELRRVLGASWQEEIGAVSELVIERGGPTLLFEEIPGYSKGYRVVSNVCNTRATIAVALGLNPQSSREELAEQWETIVKGCEPIPPQEVSSGPVLENVMMGEEVDLFRFPTPQWHDKDIGRYIGTGLCVIQQDPDTGFVNAGSYRVVIHDEKTCGIFMEAGRHGDVIRRKHWQRGERCPVVISVGQEPILTEIAGSTIYRCREGESELAVAGYFHKSPVPVVKAHLTGIPMPATAEIVIEGYIPSPEEAMLPEGPFGEWTGYYGHGRRPETIVEVKAIYHRNDPIILGSPPTRLLRPSEGGLGIGELNTRRRLEAAGIPGIRGIFNWARPHLSAVALKQMYDEHVEDVIQALESGGEQYSGNHVWVLVDDDIDVTNIYEVLWAIASRLIPEHGVRVIPGTAVWQLDPRIPPQLRSNPDADEGRRPYPAHNLVINACRPYEWIDEFPMVNVNGRELRERVQEKWPKVFV